MNTSSSCSVSDLNQQVRELLLEHFSTVTVTGEISGFRNIASSGHWYFTLKDSKSEVRCAMFRGDNQHLRTAFQDGDEVQVRARVELYLPRGMYQLVVNDMSLQGQGALLQKIEALKATLQTEGLFDESRKHDLPSHPENIGIVTSSSAAALKDVLRVLHRRWPVAELFLYPAVVQGKDAPASLVEALGLATTDRRCDLLLLVRGGGSIEDLMAFNEEAVVRAVAACPIPVITGIGHESDTVLADFAADLRGATPTAAAELASPDGVALRQWCLQQQMSLTRHLQKSLLRHAQHLSDQMRRLQRTHPRNRVQTHQQRLDDLVPTMTRQIRDRIRTGSQNLALLRQQLHGLSPARRITYDRMRIAQAGRQLSRQISSVLGSRAARLDRVEATLRAVSPQSTLDRGYAIARLRTKDGSRILRDARDARPGETLDVRVRSGSVETRIVSAKELSDTRDS